MGRGIVFVEGAVGDAWSACAPSELSESIAWDRQPRLAAKCLRPFGTVEPIRVRPFGIVESIIQGASQSSGLGAATGFLLGKRMSGWFGVAHHFDIGLCF